MSGQGRIKGQVDDSAIRRKAFQKQWEAFFVFYVCLMIEIYNDLTYNLFIVHDRNTKRKERHP